MSLDPAGLFPVATTLFCGSVGATKDDIFCASLIGIGEGRLEDISVFIGGGTGLVRPAGLSVEVCPVDPDGSCRFPSKARLSAMPPTKLESAVLGEVTSRKDCSDAFRIGTASPSRRLLDGQTGGVFEGFEGRGWNSGCEDIF